MENRKVIFSDIDGTLITKDQRITDRTLTAIKKWTSLGNKFVLSSSRSLGGIEPIVARYGLRCCVSAISGALLVDEERSVIYENGFSKDLGRDVVRFLTEKGFDLTWNIFTKDRWIVEDRSHPRVALEESIVRIIAEEGSVEDLNEDDAIEKILCMCAPGTIWDVVDALNESFPDLMVCPSSDLLLEINNTGVSKAVAIEEACRFFGIDTADTIAFGDNYNDVEMLKAAALGVAMGNAPDDIKEVCDRVTDDNEHDGVAKIIEELLGEK